jgi:hypothetical protein
MTLRKKLYNLLPKPNYRAKMINGWQNTQNIIDAIKYQHTINLPEAKIISKYFQGRDEKETAQNIWNFLKQEMQYEVESGDRQTTKTLSRYLADGKGDCKHLSIFTNTILQCLGYRSIYRFAGYNDKGLQHVYTFLPDTGIIVDAVMPSFDTEKKYTSKKDINMSLYRLSGVDTDEISGINFNKVKNNIKKAASKSSTAIKKAASQIPSAAKKVTQGMKTVGLSAPRTAFLALVRLNVKGLATDLKKLSDKKGFAGLQWWYDLGGDRSALTQVIELGSKQKRIMGIEEENDSAKAIYDGYSGDGVRIGEPVTIAASIATATPILIKVYDVLKKEGLLTNVAETADLVKKGTQSFKEITGKSVSDVIFQKESGIVSTNNMIQASDLQPVNNAMATKVVTAAVAQGSGVDVNTIKEVAADVSPILIPPSFSQDSDSGIKIFNQTFTKKTLLIGGAVVVGLFLILKRKQ